MATSISVTDRKSMIPHRVDHIRKVVAHHERATGHVDLLTSWDRCLSQHALDPGVSEPVRILTSAELKDHREPLEQLIHAAADELDRLHSVVGQARYVVLLCDERGVAVDYRAHATDAHEFAKSGIYLGALWSEEVEGTNGIGTAIVEHRTVTVHRTQHFRARHISLSCSSAPILDGNGQLVAVLDVSCFDSTLSDHAHALTGALVAASARAIEERLGAQAAASWRSERLDHRGGLPPVALRRVQEYIESHLAERLSVERLAAVAGLSTFHFARAFKQSQGTTPHDYLLDRRIARAQALLDETNTSLSQIALVSGFADQSHLARHFRRRVGVAPSWYRRLQQSAE
jgi:transcriptional regulator of acetoin/glycerol metabolism